MIFSKYNYLYKSDKNGFLLFNALTNSFVQIDENAFDSFQHIKNNPKEIDQLFSEKEITQFEKAKIFVEDDYDEYLSIKMQRQLKRFDKTRMTLTIAPTLHCNFACKYCFEESRPNVYMTDKTENDVIKFINRHHDVKNISITWFGGEPLLSFDRICSLTEKIGSTNIPFQASIVTNGYLLDQKVIDKLEELNIKSVHVTLDGLAEIHNKRRPHIKNKESFQTIYHNIICLKPLLEAKKLRLSIRVNTDKTNEDFYHELYELLKKDFKNLNVSVYAGIVKNDYGTCSSVDDTLFSNQEQANFIIKQYNKHEISNSLFMPMKVNSECMARQLYGYLIDARGDIYKCWTDVGDKTKAIGNVSSDIPSNTSILKRYLTGADLFDKEECQQCFFLPVCNGGCPHLALKKIAGDNQIELCHIAKNNLEEFLDIYYIMKTQKQ